MANELKFNPIIIDNGTGMIRAGWARSDSPRAVFPTIVGRPQIKNFNLRDSYVGDEAQSKREILSLKHPIEHGIVTNWDDMEIIWHHTFYNELRVAPEEESVLLTEAPLNPEANREKATQIMFETFDTPSMYLVPRPVLALFSGGLTTGCVLQCGHSITNCVPIYDGHILAYAVRQLEFGGRALTTHLQKLLTNRGCSFNPTFEIVQDIKEKLGYVALDFEAELSKDIPKNNNSHQTYEMPDSQVIHVDQELFKCSEPLFQPSLMGLKSSGIADLVTTAISVTPENLQANMFNSILLQGGSTMFPGISERLENELKKIHPTRVIHVRAPPERKYSAWVGACVLATTPDFSQQFITIDEYNEYGPSFVHRRCL